MFENVDDKTAQRTVPFKSTVSEKIPAFAVMKIDGIEDGIYKVKKPDGDGIDPAQLLINGEAEVAAGTGKQGRGTLDSPMLALYDTADGTPALAETWGSENASWKLKKGKNGYLVHGGAEGSGESATVLVAVKGGASAEVKACRVALAAVTSGSVKYYPANFRKLKQTPTPDTFDNGPESSPYDCYLVQDKGYDLTVNGTGDPGNDGPGCYLALKQADSKVLPSIDSTSRPVYLTTEYPMLGAGCEIRN